jgi:hypothetical protein
LAGKTLVCLPFLTLGGWSANASFTRMKKEYRGIGPSKLEFVTGSMDDTIMDTLETGDLIFFSRQLTSLQPLAAIWSFLMRLKYHTRFDHCGFIYVDKLGRKFIVEETFSKVQCRPYSARILTSHAKEIAIVPLKNIHRTKEIQNQAFQFVSENIERPSRLNIRRFVSALFDPSIYPPSTSKEAPLFPAAGNVLRVLYKIL